MKTAKPLLNLVANGRKGCDSPRAPAPSSPPSSQAGPKIDGLDA